MRACRAALTQLLAEARFRTHSSARRIRFVLCSWVKCFQNIIFFSRFDYKERPKNECTDSQL